MLRSSVTGDDRNSVWDCDQNNLTTTTAIILLLRKSIFLIRLIYFGNRIIAYKKDL